VQVKEALFDDRRGRRVYGARMGDAPLFPTSYALDPIFIAARIGHILRAEGRAGEDMNGRLQAIESAMKDEGAPDLAVRLPYFCSGCPHNTSTRLPEGARAYAGIGCHYMVQWMDRETVGFTQMGGEGANWIGEAPFSTRDHVFQNLGDGTYNHSGVQAIRAALAAGTTITYKILFNDAVAMTGGQRNEGGLTPDRIARELAAMGVGHIAIVHDEKEAPDPAGYPAGAQIHPRADLDAVQERFRKIKGVSAIIYIQTCAAEKRRRRKRGDFPDPDQRIFINPDVCEGCGDCGVQSNCVSIVPLETDFGRKRMIDQSSCNKDFSCIKGFCPSFVTLEGARPKRSAPRDIETGDLPAPVLPVIDGTFNIVITGVGGTGVVTLGAILAMAARLEDKGAGMIEMAGLAQKGGAVHIHCRIAGKPQDISAIRVSLGEADCVIGGDLVVTAEGRTLGLMRRGRTNAVVNSHETITGEFTRDRDFRIPGNELRGVLEARLGADAVLFDATRLASLAMGDSIYSNMIVLGAAWQRGGVPLSLEALRRAITLNGAAVAENLRAFEIGRWAIARPDAAAAMLAPAVPVAASPEAQIARRADHVAAYQSRRLARRYRALVERFEDPALRLAVAKGYHKLLTYKDEYEVARLHLTTMAQARAQFGGAFTPRFHLAPPLLSRPGPDGRPVKRAFGPWMLRVFAVLARLKVLRGTALDPFGRTAERRMERALIRQYEEDMAEVLSKPRTGAAREAARALAEVPLSIRGFGPVKEAAAQAAAARRADLLVALRGAADGARRAAE
jgi:indolepyruvate ferredoxin oxidoreductase